MSGNKFLYKQRAYIYAALAVIAFAFAKQSKIAFFSGMVLLVCSYVVFELRSNYQKRQQELAKKHENLTEKIIKDKDKITIVDRR